MMVRLWPLLYVVALVGLVTIATYAGVHFRSAWLQVSGDYHERQRFIQHPEVSHYRFLADVLHESRKRVEACL